MARHTSRSSAGLATASTSALKRTGRVTALALLGALFVGASGVSTASAAPDWDIRFNGRDVSIHSGHSYGRGHRHHRRINQRKVDFKRGYDAGAMTGFQEGYMDAVNHREKCGHEYICPSNVRAFRQGFEKAYGTAYAKGWAMGQHACRTQHFGPQYGYDY